MDVADESADSEEEEAGAGAEGGDDGPADEEPFEVIQSSLIVLDPNALDAINPHITADVEQMPIVRMELMSDLVIDVEFLNAKPRWTFAAATNENEEAASGSGIEPVEDGFLIRGTILPPHSGYVVLRARNAGVYGAVNVYGVGKFELWRNGEPFHTANLIAYPPAGSGMAESLADQAMGMMGGGTLGGEGSGGYCDGDCPTECAGGCDDGCTIDVLMLYTSAADEFYSNINLLMDTRIGEANSILVDSGIMTRKEDLLRVVYVGELEDYDESEIPEGLLKSALFNSETAENLRNALRADLVSLWIDPLTPTSWGGTATRPTMLSLAAERQAYSVVRSHNAGTMTHEFGHNFGCRHDRFKDCGCNCTDACGGGSCGSCDAIYDFAFGWHFSIPAGSAQSLMAYRTSSSGVPCFDNADEPWLFSSPDVYYPDEQTGSPTGESGCADNALVIKGDEYYYGTRFLVAQHRTPDPPPGTTWMIESAAGPPPTFDNLELDDAAYAPAISRNGRHVVFSSDAKNLPGYTFPDPSHQHVFHYGVESGVVALRSFDRNNPSVAADGHSGNPAISGNGQQVIFVSDATNLGSGTINSDSYQIWLKKRGASGGIVLSRASDTPNPNNPPTVGEIGNDDSEWPAANHDGTQVAYTSWATNLVDDDENGKPDIFVAKEVSYEYCTTPPIGDPECFDASAIETVRVSASTNGDEANDECILPEISETGRFVTFASTATNLAPGDTLGYYNIFPRDRDFNLTGIFDVPQGVETFRISRAWDHPTDVPNNHSVNHGISGDGRFVVFQSSATNLLDPLEWTTHSLSHNIFLHDRDTGTTHLVTKHWDQATFPNESAIGDSVLPSISADGKWIVFTSDSDELHQDHTTIGQRIYIYSVEDDEFVRVIDETEVSGYEPAPSRPVISGDGRFIAAGIWSTGSDPDQVLLHDRGRLNIYDLNGDGCVDNADRQIVSLHMGYDCSVADVNGDGVVAQDDLDELMDNWDPCEE